MTANQRFKLMVYVLFCITTVGTTFLLVSLDQPPKRGALGHKKLVPRYQPTGAWQTEARPAARGRQLIEKSSRLAFVRPSVGALRLPQEAVVEAANPQSWSTEVTEQPVVAAVPRSTVGDKRSRPSKKKIKSSYTLKERLDEISPTALARVAAKFQSANVAWPPAEVAFVAIKDEKHLELYARPKDGAWKFVHRYKVLAASGVKGPKLLRGDKQVPEGVYRITYLNPNSAYHVSLRVNYPNAFDRKMAKKDGRRDMGGDIMIHGKNVSAGCLAVGDGSAEELFVLAAEVGKKNIKLVIAPTDFRRKPMTVRPKGPKWVPALYTEIASEMAQFETPPPPSLLSLLGF
ncbi:MAG: L,D-transpeptidase family protein [Hyphomicrobiaceae bacterium]